MVFKEILEVEIQTLTFRGLALFESLIGYGTDCQAARESEALLHAGEKDIDPEPVEFDFHASHRGDRVDTDRHVRVFLPYFGAFVDGSEDAGGSFIEDKGHAVVIAGRKAVIDH